MNYNIRICDCCQALIKDSGLVPLGRCPYCRVGQLTEPTLEDLAMFLKRRSGIYEGKNQSPS